MHKTEEPELKEDENCGQDRQDKLLSPRLRLLLVAHLNWGAPSSHSAGHLGFHSKHPGFRKAF